jgi:hypothetical protein
MKFHFDTMKVITLSNLAEMFDDFGASGDDTCMRTSLLMDIACEVMDVTVDGNHCGTLVGLQWFIEQLVESAAVEYAEEDGGYNPTRWSDAWMAIRTAYLEGPDKAGFCYVNVTD